MIEILIWVLSGIIGSQLYKHSKTYRKWVENPFGVHNDNGEAEE